MEKINDKIKVAIYLRATTNSEVLIEEQKRKLMVWCKYKHYELYKIYSDNGFSGIDEKRPAYNQLLSDVKKKQFNLVIAVNMDRLNRNISELNKILDIILKYNCNLETLNDQIDTSSPAGKLFTRMLQVFNRFENEPTTNE